MTKPAILLAAAGTVLTLGSLLYAQKNEFPFDSYTIDGDLTTIHVQGNVYVIQGAGGNVAVQVGSMGLAVVDTGLERNADKLLASIRKLSDKPIQ